MAHLIEGDEAFGQPGRDPSWSRANKNGVGTAYSTSSRVWFTLQSGRVTEIYWPTLGMPQIRDWQLAIGDGKSFTEDERSLGLKVERMERCLGYLTEGRGPLAAKGDGYTLTQEILTDSYLPCVLKHIKVEASPERLRELRLYTLCAPHLDGGGWENNAYLAEAVGRRILVAERNGSWVAVGATVPFSRTSCGYAGVSDGATDLREHHELTWSFAKAPAGNVTLTGEIELGESSELTLGLAFGRNLNNAVTNLLNALSRPWEAQRERFVRHWRDGKRSRLPLQEHSFDGGALYEASLCLLLAHEDKAYPGAFVASLSIPWGDINSEDRPGGYHLVWVRDLFIAATGLLAAGDKETPMRSLIYLAASQSPDGSFPQSFRLEGEPLRTKIQLDQVAFPIILAYRLQMEDALGCFDPYPVVRKAVAYLIGYGPATEQERWEENSGYSPSTTAVVIASMICGAILARRAGDEATALAAEGYADFLECHLEDWMVTRTSQLVPGIERHYVRITPGNKGDAPPCCGPDGLKLTLTSQPPEGPYEYPASDIVDAGFLELVRWGIRSPHDPIIVDSVKVVDALLKVETPYGPCWKRYNHDGYGQRPDGSAFKDWGQGRPWPLLIGERGAYEVAAGRDISALIKTMEGLAGPTHCLPEQVWDGEDMPELELVAGGPTGSACPLLWPHSQYLKLLRFSHEGQVLDRIPELVERYQGERKCRRPIEIWGEAYPAASAQSGRPLRIQVSRPYRLRWSTDGWATEHQSECLQTSLGFHYVELLLESGPLLFKLFWLDEQAWDDQEHRVDVVTSKTKAS
jgi:glucoamylase